MSDRITEKHLQGLVNYINELTNSPLEPWTRDEKGFRANIGNFHLDGAYGGVQLVRMCSDGGGITQPLGGGFVTKRELYNKMTVFIRGIEEGKALK